MSTDSLTGPSMKVVAHSDPTPEPGSDYFSWTATVEVEGEGRLDFPWRTTKTVLHNGHGRPLRERMEDRLRLLAFDNPNWSRLQHLCAESPLDLPQPDERSSGCFGGRGLMNGVHRRHRRGGRRL